MKKTYFRFYDQLPEPIRGWAKENWDEKFTGKHVPETLLSAIYWGFNWEKSPQGESFWYFVYNKCTSKSLLTDAKKNFPELFKPAKTSHRNKIMVKPRKDGSWMFSPVGGNGKKLNHQYSNKYGAIRAAKAFKIQMANATIIDEKGNKIEFDL